MSTDQIRRDAEQPCPHGPAIRIEGPRRADCRYEGVRQQILGEVPAHPLREEAEEVGGMVAVHAAPLDEIDSFAGFHRSTSLRRHDQLHTVYLPAATGLLHELFRLGNRHGIKRRQLGPRHVEEGPNLLDRTTAVGTRTPVREEISERCSGAAVRRVRSALGRVMERTLCLVRRPATGRSAPTP